MTGRVLRRFGAALATLVAASILVWIMLMAAPTDPVEGILRARGILEPDPYQVAAMRAELGLDDPPVTRYLHWLAGWFQGDFGVSWKSGRPSPSKSPIARTVCPAEIQKLQRLSRTVVADISQ